jgi:hypothetical protein
MLTCRATSRYRYTMSRPRDAAEHLKSSSRIRTWRVRRVRFWIESLVAGASLILGLVTLVWQDWIEGVFRVDPDNHSGAVEWLVVAGLLVVAAVVGTVARFEWRQLQLASVKAPRLN